MSASVDAKLAEIDAEIAALESADSAVQPEDVYRRALAAALAEAEQAKGRLNNVIAANRVNLIEVNHLQAEAERLRGRDAKWRELLWLRHGCEAARLYGDDGEMQCGACGGLDFKRMDPEDIEAVWRRKAVAAMNAAAAQPPQGGPEVKP